MVISDNATRWNSTCSMLERALLLRNVVDEFVERRITDERRLTNMKRRVQNIDKDQLSPSDWEELKHLNELLQPFKQLCLDLEKANSNGSLLKMLLSMDYLLCEYTR